MSFISENYRPPGSGFPRTNPYYKCGLKADPCNSNRFHHFEEAKKVPENYFFKVFKPNGAVNIIRIIHPFYKKQLKRYKLFEGDDEQDLFYNRHRVSQETRIKRREDNKRMRERAIRRSEEAIRNSKIDAKNCREALEAIKKKRIEEGILKPGDKDYPQCGGFWVV